jgi:alkyl hydroperoxide reductase subunit AhpF
MVARELHQDINNDFDLDCEECPDEVLAAELWAEIEDKAQRHLGLSGVQFVREYRSGHLVDTFAVAEIGFLLRCLDDAFIPA